MSYTLSTFGIKDEWLQNFTRREARKSDCVINLLEVLQALTPETAAIIRVLRGCYGIEAQEIVKIFSILKPKRRWKLQSYQPVQSSEFYARVASIPKNQVTIAGIEYLDGSSHVFFLGRTNRGEEWIIDPQIGLILNCTAEPIHCNKFLEFNTKRLFLLLSAPN